MVRIALVVLRVIFKLPYWWFYRLKKYANKKVYPTIDEGYHFCHQIAQIIVKKARVDLVCTGLDNLPQNDGTNSGHSPKINLGLITHVFAQCEHVFLADLQ